MTPKVHHGACFILLRSRFPQQEQIIPVFYGTVTNQRGYVLCSEAFDIYLFIYCNWVSTCWQWSVGLYKNRDADSYVHKEKQHKTVQKQRIHKIEFKNRKQIT